MNQGGGRGWPAGDEAARLARVEQQLADLQAEVAQLKRVLNRSSDLERGGHLPGSGPAALVSAGQAGAGHAEVVLTVVAASRDDKKAPQVRGRPAEVEVHVIVHAPPGFGDWARGQPSPLREDVTRLVEGMRERLSEQAAGRVIDVVWEPATSGWRVVDFGGFDKMAGLPANLSDWGHQQAGAWAARVGTAAGLSRNFAGAGAVICYLVPLPFDRALHDVSRVIQIAGILAFALPGGHMLACASLKSLAHDKLTDLLAKQLRTVIWEPVPAPAEPARHKAQPAAPAGREKWLRPKPSEDPSSAAGTGSAEPAASAPPDPARPNKQAPEPGSPSRPGTLGP